MASFEKQYEILKTKYPKQYENICKKHPKFAQNVEQAMGIMKTLDSNNRNLSDKELVDKVDAYRLLALEANEMLRGSQRGMMEAQQHDLESAALGELPLDTSELSQVEKAELKRLSDDLYREFFPESNVDQFVRWTTGQKKLDWYQKLLLGPANGIESAVTGAISLLKPQTYKDFANTIQTTAGMSIEDWCNTWKTVKFMHENLSASDEIAPVVSFLTSIVMLGGGIAKVGQLTQKLGYAPHALSALSRVTKNGNIIGKALPITVMAGLSLPIIESARTKEKAVA